MREAYVQARLWDHFYKDHKYMFTNMYFFNNSYESDFISFLDNGYCHDYEIKCSHQDFLNDFKKEDKHKFIKEGSDCANRFYFVAPFGMIKVSELPPYAGLVEVDEVRVRIKKQAPLLHKKLWNPALHFDRVYKKYNKFMNTDMNERLDKEETKRKNKYGYRKKKGKNSVFEVAPKYLDGTDLMEI